jgi:hypothetical protein
MRDPKARARAATAFEALVRAARAPSFAGTPTASAAVSSGRRR